MDGLEDIADDIAARLDEKDEIREIALKSSRSVIRLCGTAIRQMHAGGDYGSSLREAGEELNRLVGISRDFPDILHSGIVESAMVEYVELGVLDAYLNSRPMPGPDALGVTPEAYILGVGDAIGEMRRLVLDNIRHGDVPAAARHLDSMEALYDFLIGFNYPSGLVAVRRKQDIARSVLEKTRGDVTLAMRTHALEEKLDRMVD